MKSMNPEKIEHAVTERVLSIAPGIASAEVMATSPIDLPGEFEGQAYVGVVAIGAGKSIPGASAKAIGLPSFESGIHEKTLVANFFVFVAKEKIHVYLENQTILDFLRREA